MVVPTPPGFHQALKESEKTFLIVLHNYSCFNINIVISYQEEVCSHLLTIQRQYVWTIECEKVLSTATDSGLADLNHLDRDLNQLIF